MENAIKFQQEASNWNEALPIGNGTLGAMVFGCLLYTSPSPRDVEESRMPSSA